MDEEPFQPHSDFLPNERGKRLANGGVDRISELPNEILFVILSFLPVRTAASTTVLSSRWLDLWKHIPNLKFNLESDRISQLPDEIISLILSFLPLKKAAATCVLSSRWLDSWKHTPILNFDHCIAISMRLRRDTHKYIEIVNSVLQSHKALSLKQFGICFFRVNKSAKRAVNKWLEKCLEFVFLRKVESLEFDCWAGEDKIDLGESLREISTICGDPQTLIFFQSLKSLQLACLEVSGEDIGLVVRNCPLLEKLMIRYVSLTSDIEVCSPLLKRLEIYGCSGAKSIKVSAPNLSFIRFDDEVGKLLFGNVPRLIEAAFDINTSEFVMHHFASAASCHISQLQMLDICLPHPKVFWMNVFPQMPNLKKLSITCYEIYYHSLMPVTHVVWACPRLEEFKLEFFGFDEAPSAYMKEIAIVGRSPHQHLKVFHLYWPHHAQGVRDHAVELVTYISNNCIALHRIDTSSVPDYPLQSQIPNHVQLSIRTRESRNAVAVGFLPVAVGGCRC